MRRCDQPVVVSPSSWVALDPYPYFWKPAGRRPGSSEGRPELVRKPSRAGAITGHLDPAMDSFLLCYWMRSGWRGGAMSPISKTPTRSCLTLSICEMMPRAVRARTSFTLSRARPKPIVVGHRYKRRTASQRDGHLPGQFVVRSTVYGYWALAQELDDIEN